MISVHSLQHNMLKLSLVNTSTYVPEPQKHLYIFKQALFGSARASNNIRCTLGIFGALVSAVPKLNKVIQHLFGMLE